MYIASGLVQMSDERISTQILNLDNASESLINAAWFKNDEYFMGVNRK